MDVFKIIIFLLNLLEYVRKYKTYGYEHDIWFIFVSFSVFFIYLIAFL